MREIASGILALSVVGLLLVVLFSTSTRTYNRLTDVLVSGFTAVGFASALVAVWPR